MSKPPKKHRFKKDKDGLEIEVTDPVQDIMEDEELTEAEKRIELLSSRMMKTKNPRVSRVFLEARTGFEPVYELLQSSA